MLNSEMIKTETDSLVGRPFILPTSLTAKIGLGPVGLNPAAEVGNVSKSMGISTLTPVDRDKGVDAILGGSVALTVKEWSTRVTLEKKIKTTFCTQ